MAQTGVIISRKANQEIPVSYLEKAVAENPTAWGLSWLSSDGISVACGDGITVELIQQTCTDYPDRDITFYLCNSESAINMDDVSPFTLVEENEQNRILGFVTGEFNGFAKEKSTHPSAFFFVNEHLIPKMKDMYELADGNLAKIMTLINKETFKKELLAHSTAHGVITFVMADGESTTLASSDQCKQFPWGWVSNHYGFGAEPAKVEKKSLIPNKSTVREAHKPSVPTAGAASAAPGPVTTKVTSSADTAASAIVNYTIGKWAPKAGLSRKDKKGWFQRVLGYAPRGFDNPGFTCDAYFDTNGNVMLMSDIKRLGLAAASLPPLNNPGRDKDTEADNLPDKSQPTGPAVTDEVLPIMSPAARKWANEFIERADVKKLIAENAAVISDPATIKQIEQKFAGFGEQLGKKEGLKDWARLDYPRCLEVVKEKPEVAGNLLWNLLNIYRTMLANKEAKLTTGETHTVAQQELRPEPKKRMIPNKKAADA